MYCCSYQATSSPILGNERMMKWASGCVRVGLRNSALLAGSGWPLCTGLLNMLPDRREIQWPSHPVGYVWNCCGIGWPSYLTGHHKKLICAWKGCTAPIILRAKPYNPIFNELCPWSQYPIQLQNGVTPLGATSAWHNGSRRRQTPFQCTTVLSWIGPSRFLKIPAMRLLGKWVYLLKTVLWRLF